MINRITARNFLTCNSIRNSLKETPGAEKLPNLSTLNTNLKNLDPQKMSKIQEMYIEKLNARNSERYLKEKRIRTHYRISGAIFACIALSIYGYTMFAIRQEKFLDDFDEPVLPDSVADPKAIK